MTDTTTGTGVGEADIGALATIEARSYWIELGRRSVDLAPVLDEAIASATLILLDRIYRAFQRLQADSRGAAFPEWDGSEVELEVYPLLNGFADALLVDPSGLIVGFERPLGRLSGPFGELFVNASNLEIGEGSLWSKIKLVFAGGALAGALLVMVLENPTADLWKDFTVTVDIHRQLQGSECRAKGEVSTSIWALRSLAAEALDFDSAHLSPDDRRVAVCTLQLLLRRVGHNPGPIDGVYGYMTRTEHERYAAKFGLPVADRRVAEHLIDAIQTLTD